MISKELRESKFDRLKTGYIDESGDCGAKGSSCLVLTYVCLDEKKKVSKIMRKTKKALMQTNKGNLWLNRHGGEIKFNSFPDQHLLLKTLEELAKLKFDIMFRAFKKEGKRINLSEKNRLLHDLLTESLVNKKPLPRKIVADKDYFQNKKIACLTVKDYIEETYPDGKGSRQSYHFNLIEEDEYYKDQINFDLTITIKHENSKNSVELQVADLISGAIFQELEHNDKTYTDIIRKHAQIRGGVIKPIYLEK
ncbi:DUF3800 domain-containing protein [Candidatus Pacearchaeota archaeon]|nr:DUF3800 domain-containing protein [Candidatus Pacearchaeota archaeon]